MKALTGYRKYAENLMRKLLRGYRIYFSRDVLNSDGRRLLEDIIKSMIYSKEYHPGLIRSVRRNPSMENVLKLARILLDEEEIEDLLKTGIEGPIHNSAWHYLERE